MPATSHDVMPDIELYQPTDEANALDLASTLGSDGWIVGGGQDTYGWLKLSESSIFYSLLETFKLLDDFDDSLLNF